MEPTGILNGATDDGSIARATNVARPALGRRWFLLIPIALVFGAAAGVCLDRTRGRFYVQPPILTTSTPEQEKKYAAEKYASMRREAGLISALGVGVISGGLGLAFGLLRARVSSAAFGLVVGAVLGAGLGAVGGMYGLDYYSSESVSGAKAGMQRSATMQATFWAPVAVAVVIAGVTVFGSPRSLGSFLVTGVIGAVGASFLVPIGGTILLVMTGKDMKDAIPPATLHSCLLMGMLGTGLMAVCLWPSIEKAAGASGSLAKSVD